MVAVRAEATMVAVVRAEDARVAGMEVAATEGSWVAVGMAAAAAAVVAMVAVAAAGVSHPKQRPPYKLGRQ